MKVRYLFILLSQAADLSLYQISEQDMKTVFQKLDTDSDGHLMYQQVEPQFPSNLNKHQKRYLKQVDYVGNSLKCICRLSKCVYNIYEAIVFLNALLPSRHCIPTQPQVESSDLGS